LFCTRHEQACASKENNVWITPRSLWITTPSVKLTCGWRTLLHRRAELSTSPVHGSSTALWPRRLQGPGLSTQSTGPMTMTRPRRYGFRSEYLGTTVLGTKTSGRRPKALNPRPTTGSTCHMLAKSHRGTRVDPHLCKSIDEEFSALQCRCEHPCSIEGAGYR